MGVETGRQDSIPKRERKFGMYWYCESAMPSGVCLISISRMYLRLPFTVTLHRECKEVTYRVYSFVSTSQGYPDILSCDLNKSVSYVSDHAIIESHGIH